MPIPLPIILGLGAVAVGLLMYIGFHSRRQTASPRSTETGTPPADRAGSPPAEEGGTPLPDEIGSLSGLFDTNTREVHEQVRQVQKMEAIGRLAGGVAHDFNNILTVITGYSEVLLDLLGNFKQARDMVLEIKTAGERAAALTRQLLAFSRKQVLKPQVVDLNELVRNMEKMLRRLIPESIAFETSLHPEPVPIKIDPGQMEQVLMNVVINARDAMPSGGKLLLSTRPTRLQAGSVRAGSPVSPGDYALLTITDNGEGMSEEVKARIFEPFFTTKGANKGTGLGLATVYGIIKQSGGHIRVDSKLGQGSTFRIGIPIVNEPLPHAGKPSLKPVSARGSETILLVEDEPGVRLLGKTVLKEQGYHVLEATDGLEALSCLENHSGEIDLVISDVIMPRLGGVELIERIRKRWPKVKAMLVSGHNESAVLREGIEHGDTNFLSKPFSPADLTRTVRAVLDRSKSLVRHVGRT